MNRFVVLAAIVSTGCAACAADEGGALSRLSMRVDALEARIAALSPPPPAPIPAAPGPEPAFVPDEPGWSLSGGGREAYRVHLDPLTKRDGKATAKLSPATDAGGKYGTWARGVDATPYVGKRVRFSVFTKTTGTTERADFWARVQAADSPSDGSGLAGRWIRLPADSDWTRREVVLDVDSGAAQLQYGVGIAGPGGLWFDAPKLEVVDASVPVTPKYEGEQTVGDWHKTGVGAPDYKLEADGKDVRVEPSVASSNRFVTVLRRAPAGALAGKKVKAAFDVRTEGLAQEGNCIVKVQMDSDLAYGGFLAFDMKPVASSTKGFVPCNLEVMVPAHAKWILYGFTYRGAGKAWLRGGSLK